MKSVRSGDDDLGVHKMPVEGRVLALFVRSSHELVAMVLDPFPQSKFVLSRSKELRNLLGVFMTLRYAQLTMTFYYLTGGKSSLGSERH